MAVQWEAILRKLDDEGQAQLLQSIAIVEENAATAAAVAAATADKAVAKATEGLAAKDSEIAKLRTALALSGGGMRATGRRTFTSTSHRLSNRVSGDSYTALSSLYSSTHGANWTLQTNWMSGDPCTASW